MRKLITAATVALSFLTGAVSASESPLDCVEITLDNVKSIYEKRENILIKNPYIDGVCVGVTFSQNDNGDFNDYYESIGITADTVMKLQGDHQHVSQAMTKSGHVFQLLIYVTDGTRGDKVASMFGEKGQARKEREELMFYHEVSHLIKESVTESGGVNARELETMADISALHIYAHVNKLDKDELLEQARHLFRDRQRGLSEKGYNWFYSALWVNYLEYLEDAESVEVESFASVYDYIIETRDAVNAKPTDLVGLFSSLF